jgi:hypothetical protein
MNHKKSYCHNKKWDFLLDNNVVWFLKCHKYFHKDNDKVVLIMDATILEGVCGCIEFVHNTSRSKHMKHLCLVLTKQKEVNLKLNPNKCVFIVKSIKFLGHVINKKGTMFDLLKIKVVVQFSVLVFYHTCLCIFGFN